MAKKTVLPTREIIDYTDKTWAKAKRDFLKQDQKRFVESLTKIIEYLEADEKKDYEARPMSAADTEEHIYQHILKVKQYVVNEGLKSQDVDGLVVDNVAKYLFSLFWLGVETGPGNSSTRDTQKEQYYEVHKSEFLARACSITKVCKEAVYQADTTGLEGAKTI